MAASKGPKDSNVSQSERFKEAARELGCDESEAAFDEKLRRIRKATAQKDKPRPPQPRKRSQ